MSGDDEPSLAPLALTMGEPAGIGGEIALKAWLGRQRFELAPFFAIDDPARLGRLAAQLGLEVAVQAIDSPAEAAAAFAAALPVLPLELPVRPRPGRPDPANAAAVIESIDRALRLALGGGASGMVTNPIHKRTLYQVGFAHPGHTEYLAETVGGGPAVMMLLCPGLKAVPVTVHLSLAAALAALSRDRIVAAAATTAAALQEDFGILRPRLAVAGVNPHAGEDGSLGREEIEVIAPAVEDLAARGIDVFGPVSADSLFRESARRDYDAAICMYHDQALIPLKTIDFDHGVNVTLGLPLVRTSPDHGTALALAGSGEASEASLVAAIRTAAGIAQQRARAAGRAARG